MSNDVPLQAAQILCVDCEDAVLFTELIQVAQGKALFWVRPIALRRSLSPKPTLQRMTQPSEPVDQFYDLRQSSDLLLPASLFRSAFDLEFLPILALFRESEAESVAPLVLEEAKQQTQLELRAFINQLCKAFPNQFCSQKKVQHD